MSASDTEKEARRGKGPRGRAREGATKNADARGDKGKAAAKSEKSESKETKETPVAKEATFESEALPAAAAKPSEEPENKWIALAERYAWVLVPALLPAAIVAGVLQGPQAVLLLLIGALLVAVIWLFWNSLRTMTGETALTGADAYALAAPRAEEEQKQAVLRALKDLEFERSVGKISDEDYAVLVARYRQEAKRLLRAIEEEARPRRESVEWLVHKRLVQAGLADPTNAYRTSPAGSAAKADPVAEAKRDAKKKKMKDADKPVIVPAGDEDAKSGPDDAADGEEPKRDVDTTLRSGAETTTKESPVYVPATKLCASCGAKNDPDAIFCKKCGSKRFDDAKSWKIEGDRDDRTSESDGAAEAAEDEAAETEAEDRDAEARR